MELNQISGAIVSAAIKIHSELGPGLMESVYEKCLIHELNRRGLRVVSQLPLAVNYDGICIDAGYKLDLLVEDAVVVELKATREGITELHKAQLLTYLKLTGKKLGLIINFNVVHMKEGIRRMVLGEIPYSAPRLAKD
jgi:GxxExxY protein